MQEWIAVVGAKTAYIERGSPPENVRFAALAAQAPATAPQREADTERGQRQATAS